MADVLRCEVIWANFAVRLQEELTIERIEAAIGALRSTSAGPRFLLQRKRLSSSGHGWHGSPHLAVYFRNASPLLNQFWTACPDKVNS
jgi:hypothetical protein